MQTFLPYDSFERSASCLDNRRLGKQRVEVLQILNTLAGRTSGWGNHPAVRMWRNHGASLAQYGLVICTIWTDRGFNDTCFEKILRLLQEEGLSNEDIFNAPPPNWFGDQPFHISHKSNLLRKDPTYYGPIFPDTPNNLPYIWPV